MHVPTFWPLLYSTEDGPLGALAILRALAKRGAKDREQELRCRVES